jgi:hypothetical protein
MSKNFDLLTQLGERFALLPPPETPLENLPPAPSHLLGTPIVREKPEAASRGEEIELVQQVFLLPGTEAPKTVVFCGVDEDDVASSLCVSVGESLVAHTSGDVCIVDANLENPFLHKQYGPIDDLGITDLVLASGNGSGKRVARRIGDKPLWLHWIDFKSRFWSFVRNSATSWSARLLRLHLARPSCLAVSLMGSSSFSKQILHGAQPR